MHYGVPVVCLPVNSDQPRNAYRIADELGCGIRLRLETFTPDELAKAAEEVLNDMAYSDRVYRLSQASRTHNGVQNACELMLKYIDDCRMHVGTSIC